MVVRNTKKEAYYIGFEWQTLLDYGRKIYRLAIGLAH